MHTDEQTDGRVLLTITNSYYFAYAKTHKNHMLTLETKRKTNKTDDRDMNVLTLCRIKYII